MDIKRVYEDFIPTHEFVRQEGAGILIVELPGYRKEQLRVQIDNYGNLRISGERPLGDNRWRRFHKEFQVPENCNVSDIRAKFENELLYVILPKLITEVKGKEQPAEAPQKPEEDKKPTTEPKPAVRQDDMKPKAPVEPNGVTKKEEDEKRGEPMAARKDEQKVVKDEAEEGVAEPAVTGRDWNWARKLAGELGFGLYEPRQIMVNVIVAVVVLFAVGWYVTYKLSRPMKEDGH